MLGEDAFVGVRKLGIFGGSFDPVHQGHLHVARAASQAFGLERVVFVPAARPPHKPGRILASGADRVAMLELALAVEPRWSISELELSRTGPSYTIDTVRELPSQLGLSSTAQLFLLIGWDNLHGFERWRRASELLELVQPIVVLRDPGDEGLLETLRGALPAELFANLERGLVRVPPVRISSTDLRGLLARGEDPGDALPPAVWEYIRARGIYRAAPSPR